MSLLRCRRGPGRPPQVPAGLTGGPVVLFGAGSSVGVAASARLRARDIDVRAVDDEPDLGAVLHGAYAVVIVEDLPTQRRFGRTGNRARRRIRDLASALQGSSVERIVYMSWPGAHRAAYNGMLRAKAESERALRETGKALTVLRCGPVLRKPDDREAWARAVRPLRGRVGLPCAKDGPIMPLLSDDVATLAVAAALHPRTPAGTFDVGTDRPLSMEAFVWHLNDARPTVVRYPRWSQVFWEAFFPRNLARGRRLLLPYAAMVTDRGEFARGLMGQPLRSLADLVSVPEEACRPREAGRLRPRVKGEMAPLWLLFMVATAGTAVVGTHDVIWSVDMAARANGLGLLIAAIVLAAGWRGLASGRASRHAVAVQAGVIGVVVSAVLLLAQARADPEPWRLVVWGVLVALFAASTYLLWQPGWLDLRANLRHRFPLQVLTSIVSIGTLISLFQLWREQLHQPATQAPFLSVDAQITPGKLVGDRRALSAVVTVKNDSDTRVQILGAAYQLERFAVRRDGEAGRPEEPVRRYADWESRGVAESGRLFDEGSSLEPKESATRRVLVHVPPGREGDVASFVASIVTAKGRIVRIHPRPRREVPGARLFEEYAVDERSWLREIIRGERVLRVRWSREGELLPDCEDHLHAVVAWFDDADRPVRGPCDGRARVLSRYYGVADVHASDAVALTRP